MKIDKTKVKELFIAGSLNPSIAMLFRAKAGMPGLLIYLYVKWRLGFPHYLTKQKRTWNHFIVWKSLNKRTMDELQNIQEDRPLLSVKENTMAKCDDYGRIST